MNDLASDVCLVGFPARLGVVLAMLAISLLALEQARKSFGGWRRKSKAVSRWRNGRPERYKRQVKRHKSAGAPRAPRPCEGKCKSECSFQLALHFLPAHTSRCTTATAHGLPTATPCAHRANHCTRRIRPHSTPRPSRRSCCQQRFCPHAAPRGLLSPPRRSHVSGLADRLRVASIPAWATVDALAGLGAP